MEKLIEKAIAAHRKWQEASQEAEAVRTSDSPEAQRALDKSAIMHGRFMNARERCCKELAAQRGWAYVPARKFRPADLAPPQHSTVQQNSDYPLLDHTECFQTREHPRRPVAILSHSYHAFVQSHQEFAQEHGLAVEFLSVSWYAPGVTLAALYTRP